MHRHRALVVVRLDCPSDDRREHGPMDFAAFTWTPRKEAHGVCQMLYRSGQAGNWRRKSMAGKVRYNKIIDLLEHGKPVFSTSTVPNGSLDDLTFIADADYDAVIIEMEHEGFSFTTLRTSLQVLLNRKRIAGRATCNPTWCRWSGFLRTPASATNG